MSTPVEAFEQLVRKQGLLDLVQFLLQLEKADVMPVRLKTKQLYREMNDWRLDDKRRLPRDKEPMLFLAGLATFSKQEGLGRSFGLPWQFQLDNHKHEAHHRDLFWAVVRHSRPTWLTAWFERVARDDAWRTAPYRLLRELNDEGLISHEPWLFAQSVAHWLNHHNRDQRGKAREYDLHVLRQLRADHVLLTRDLPLLFDFDTPVDSATIYRGNDREAITWLTLLPALAESGHLDRAGLLTRSLLALRRDFRRPLLTWFKNLFLTLSPTPEEQLARQAELVELLAHPLPLVVNFALDQLKAISPLDGFDAAPLLLYADGLMARQDLKTALRSLLGTLEKLTKRNPALAPTVAQLATSALANADAAVQERAAKLLASVLGAKKAVLTAADATATTEAISFYSDLFSPAARVALAPFMAEAPAQPLAVEAASSSYAPLVGFQPAISQATAIAPVSDWHELLYLTGEVLQHTSPLALERWLDGLLRLRPHFPAGYQQQLLPYLHQAFPWALNAKSPLEVEAILKDYTVNGGRVGLRELVQALLISWFSGFTQRKVALVNLSDQPYNIPDPLLRVEQRRFVAVENALRTAPTLPLLSSPSHAPHWVAPTVLVEKLLAYQAAGVLPDAADLALALARTAIQAEANVGQAVALLPRLQHEGLRELLGQFFAPEPAATAPAAPATDGAGKTLLKSFTERLGRLVSFKHQQPAGVPIPLEESLPWLRAVAARTRFPEHTLESLRPQGTYPGLAEPWQPDWRFERKSHTYQQSWNKARPEVTNVWQELHVPTDHPGQVPPSPLLLYSLHARLSQKQNYYLWSLAPDLPFLLTLLPNNPGPLHWHLLRTACRVDNIGAEGRDVMSVFLRSLLAPGPRFDESASVLLACGLVHSAPVCRALALEVLLAASGTGRLVPAATGQALGRLLAAEFTPIQRLTDGLAQARAISPTTDDALRQTLDALLPELPAAPLRNMRKLLDAYADVLARTRQPTPTAAHGRLREWQAVPSLKKTTSAMLA
ncbi:MAG TPA: DUF6493 family protein [Hymenobacter sp.]|jgi:hypothetical protein|uniref:DUF6493 family protein n=1 Tax=Hymenobacter sp. TaxID=1898978 RepID=UPI002ED9FC35